MKEVPNSFIKTNVSGYYKDPNKGIVLNLNNEEYEAYLAGKARSKEHVALKNEVEELKRLVTMMMQKGMNV